MEFHRTSFSFSGALRSCAHARCLTGCYLVVRWVGAFGRCVFQAPGRRMGPGPPSLQWTRVQASYPAYQRVARALQCWRLSPLPASRRRLAGRGRSQRLGACACHLAWCERSFAYTFTAKRWPARFYVLLGVVMHAIFPRLLCIPGLTRTALVAVGRTRQRTSCPQ